MNEIYLHVTAVDRDLSLEIDIDEHPLRGLVNIYSLLRSLNVPASKYYLLTCSCGVPGCAGVDSEIVQIIDYTTNTVHWHFPNDSYGEHFNGKSFSFNLQKFTSAIESFKSEVRYAEARGGRFAQFWSAEIDENSSLQESLHTLDELTIDPIHEGDILESRKILLFNSVSSISQGLATIKMTQGLKRETYNLDIMYLVDGFYEELAARTNNDLRFNPGLYTLSIVYVTDSVKEGAFINDDLFLSNEHKFKGKVLKNSVMATFNKMMKMDQDPLKSIVSASSIKIISNNEEQ